MCSIKTTTAYPNSQSIVQQLHHSLIHSPGHYTLMVNQPLDPPNTSNRTALLEQQQLKDTLSVRLDFLSQPIKSPVF